VKPVTGLAKLVGRKLQDKAAGTRSYMSPEQITNQPLDFRADIYSFGCMLYELVTGKTPYTGITSDDLLSKHLSQPVPSPIVVNNMVTNEFNTLVMSMMAKRPEQRPKSMEEFQAAFRPIRIFKAKKIV
jgi:serine/threonine protein kinase